MVVCNELRSHSVHARFHELFSATHTMKKVLHTKMDDKYQHPNIQVGTMATTGCGPGVCRGCRSRENCGRQGSAWPGGEERLVIK